MPNTRCTGGTNGPMTPVIPNRRSSLVVPETAAATGIPGVGGGGGGDESKPGDEQQAQTVAHGISHNKTNVAVNDSLWPGHWPCLGKNNTNHYTSTAGGYEQNCQVPQVPHSPTALQQQMVWRSLVRASGSAPRPPRYGSRGARI